MRKIVSRGIAASSFLLAAATSHAAVVIDQVAFVRPPSAGDIYITSSVTNRTFGAGADRFTRYTQQTQSLTVGVGGTLARVGLQIYGNNATGRIDLSITRGALYTPEGRMIDETGEPALIVRNIAMPALAAANTGQPLLALVDLSTLGGMSVRKGETLSLTVSAASGTTAGWAIGTGAFDEDGNTIRESLLSYAGGYNVVDADVIYPAGDPRSSRSTYGTLYDRGFVTWVDADTSADAPLAPTSSGGNGAETFSFTAKPGERVFIDPVTAGGFDYVLSGDSPNILDVLFPALDSDVDGYRIYDLNDNFLGSLISGVFAFAPGGVNGFKVRGIDGLPAGAPFVTGLTFAAGGAVTITQTPVLTAVPEPAAWTTMALGFGVTGMAVRRRRRLARA